MSRTFDSTHRLTAAVLGLGITLGLAGCRHKVVVAPLPKSVAPVDPVESTSIEKPPLLDVPQVKLPPEPTAAAAAKPPRERKHSKTAAAPVAPEPTPAPPPPPPADASTIGALTAVGESNPETRQDAADLIAMIEKRLNALPVQTNDDGKAQVSKIRNFWRDAQDALKSGDAEGAKTLATKAKLLLDDLEK